MPDLQSQPSHPSTWPVKDYDDDTVPQLPPFYSPRPIPVSRAISELDLNSLSVNERSIAMALGSASSSAHDDHDSDGELPGLVSPQFTPP